MHEQGMAEEFIPLMFVLLALGPLAFSRQWGAFMLIMVALTVAGFGLFLAPMAGGMAEDEGVLAAPMVQPAPVPPAQPNAAPEVKIILPNGT